jgi:acetyl-CoA carboxylase carboxyl transferase subunit alpha
MWRDSTKKELAAQALRITAADLAEFGCIDGVVPEPKGGAHTDHEAAAALLDEALQKHFNELIKMPGKELVVSRYNKFRNMAQFLRAE